jgi:putative membrane protein
MSKKIFDWFLRFLKGAAIGMDFVLPGISGAALAVVFGLYEKIVSFIANITKDFFKNLMFFIPVGLGGLLGIYLISHPISF